MSDKGRTPNATAVLLMAVGTGSKWMDRAWNCVKAAICYLTTSC